MNRFLTVFSLLFLIACSVKAEPPLLFLHGQPRQGELMYGYVTPGAVVSLACFDSLYKFPSLNAVLESTVLFEPVSSEV